MNVEKIKQHIRKRVSEIISQCPNKDIQETLTYVTYDKPFNTALLACGFAELLGETDEKILCDIALFTELLTQSYNILDDIVDNHAERWGKPTGFKKYGVEKTLFAFLIYNQNAFSTIAKYNVKEFVGITDVIVANYEKDLIKGKTTERCKKAVHGVWGTYFKLLVHVVADIVHASEVEKEKLSKFSESLGYALGLVHEYNDVKLCGHDHAQGIDNLLLLESEKCIVAEINDTLRVAWRQMSDMCGTSAFVANYIIKEVIKTREDEN